MAQSDLQQAALVLSHAAPREWQSFLNAFLVHTHDITVAVTDADPAAILNAQGRAQECRRLLRVLQECEPPKTPTYKQP